jgi:hypothetical protein
MEELTNGATLPPARHTLSPSFLLPTHLLPTLLLPRAQEPQPQGEESREIQLSHLIDIYFYLDPEKLTCAIPGQARPGPLYSGHFLFLAIVFLMRVVVMFCFVLHPM